MTYSIYILPTVRLHPGLLQSTPTTPTEGELTGVALLGGDMEGVEVEA